jgi:hypothetical protein
MTNTKLKFGLNHPDIISGFVIVLIAITVFTCLTGCGKKDIPPVVQINVSADTLISIIKQKQKQYVRESRNEQDCFTSKDSARFVERKTTVLITDELKADKLYITAVIKVRELSEIEWTSLRSRCLQIYKRTWGELGRISPEGQTNAGQEVEIMITNAIVELTVSLRNMDNNQFNENYGSF